MNKFDTFWGVAKISINSLKPKQKKFLTELMTCGNVEEACDRVGISPSTGYRYKRDPVFKKAQSDLMSELIKTVAGQLQNEASASIGVLANIRDDDLNPAHSRVAAAKILLDNMFKAYDVTDTIERIEQLEEWRKELRG